jgi:hypothetical protein
VVEGWGPAGLKDCRKAGGQWSYDACRAVVRPAATEDEKAERIGAAKGIPIFGLDALSSVAYGPEAALTLLIPSAWPASPKSFR